MPGRDTSTRYPGIFARHQEKCHCTLNPESDPKTCDCNAKFYGVVYDQEKKKPRKTGRYTKISAARTARDDLAAQLRAGVRFDVDTVLTVTEAVDRFIDAARDGVALNKKRKRYKPRAVNELRFSLNHLVRAYGKKKLTAVTRGDVQTMADKLLAGQKLSPLEEEQPERKSASTVRSAINSTRSFYRWAIARDLALGNPAADVELPAPDEAARDRVATPLEFEQLLSVLEPVDRVPFAIAGYSGARHQEIQAIYWEDVDFELEAIALAILDTARKSESAKRIIPAVKPLMRIIRAEWMRQGRPTAGKVCRPKRINSKSGNLNLSNVVKRARKVWEPAGLEPIGLHECRHTFVTWLDLAGVSPKTNSILAGHSTPERQSGAASITLSRYTHTLPGELERARDLLDVFLIDRTQSERAANE